MWLMSLWSGGTSGKRVGLNKVIYLMIEFQWLCKRRRWEQKVHTPPALCYVRACNTKRSVSKNSITDLTLHPCISWTVNRNKPCPLSHQGAGSSSTRGAKAKWQWGSSQEMLSSVKRADCRVMSPQGWYPASSLVPIRFSCTAPVEVMS